MEAIRRHWVALAALAILAVVGVTAPMVTGVGSSPAALAATPEVAAKAADDAETTAALADVERFSAAFRAVAKRVKPAVVAVGVSKTVESPTMASPFDDETMRRFFGRQLPNGVRPTPRKFQQQGLGSGVIVSPDGTILTNNHVVADADEIMVRLMDGREFKGEVVGTDPPSDIAVIRIKGDHLPVAELGNSDDAQVGDWVLAVGAPFGLQQTVTSGIVSATGRANVGIADYEDFIQTDAAINPGNSGGPLVNMHGQVIGINTAIASRSGGYMGIGFAVPINMAHEVMNRLLDKGEVVRGWLGVGIQLLSKEMAESMDLGDEEGVLVSQVVEGGPAEKGGLKVGDVVVEFGGKAVKTPTELQTAVAWTEPGKKMDVVVLRDKKRETLSVEVGRRSAETESAAGGGSGQPSAVKDLGIKVAPVTEEVAQQYGYKSGVGVVVTDVDPSSLGARAGLQEGMLILRVGGKKTDGVGEFLEAMKDVDLAKGVPMLVRAGDRTTFLLIKKR